MTNYELIKKVIGNIQPVGETRTDEIRLENLKATIELTEALLDDIKDVARESGAHQHSIAEAGKVAENCLIELRQFY